MNQVNIAQGPVQYDPARLSGFRVADAYAKGDPRYQMKKLDRRGLSRGGAQRTQAGIAAAQEMAGGLADAYNAQLQGQQERSMANLQSQQQQEQYAQSLGALQQQNNYASQMAALQRQQEVLGFAGNLLGGLLR
jgi:hypothetical protein